MAKVDAFGGRGKVKFTYKGHTFRGKTKMAARRRAIHFFGLKNKRRRK